MFHVGQKVEVVIASNGFAKRDEVFPLELGAITIVVYVAGDNLRIADDPKQRFWDRTRFRPVVERKTDISVFTAMLNTKPVKVLEPLTSHSEVKS